MERLDPTLAGHKVEVQERTGKAVRGSFVSIKPDAIVVRVKSGEQSIPRASVRRIAIHDPARRIRNGLLSTAIGLGAGIGVGLAICPQCANEGSPAKFIGPGAAIGGGLGALGFLPTPYRTIYRSK